MFFTNWPSLQAPKKKDEKERREWEEWDESIQGPRPPKPKREKLRWVLYLICFLVLGGLVVLYFENKEKAHQVIEGVFKLVRIR